MKPTRVAVCCLVVSCLFALCGMTYSAFADELATIAGRITDPQGFVVGGVKVEATNINTNITYSGDSNADGLYRIPSIPPGAYRVILQKTGFAQILKPGVELHVQDIIALNFTMQLGSVSQTITVEGGAPLINTESATVSTIVDRQFVENMPLNGRTFQTLIQLAPGVVLTTSSGFDNGQFSVNGQRAESNYWIVDGVSANVGIATQSFAVANGLSGSNATLSVLGGTNSLVSVDAMREFRIQTSTFAPEFGRTPGAQISIVTRSGMNQFHGTAFDYLRNDIFDANDWFANANQLPKPRDRQNDFGGTFSGPFLKDRTFFFFSYEGLRLRLPQVALELVPDMNARQTAIPAMRPFLNAFPLPNGSGTPATGIAQVNASFSNSATLDAYGLRIDHKLNDKLTLFGRYSYSPSQLVQRGLGTLNTLSPSQITIQTATAGLTWAVSPATFNDLRFNYSRTHAKNYNYLDDFGGAVPLAQLPFPSGFNASNANFSVLWLSLAPYTGVVLGPTGDNLQRQVNIVDEISIQKGAHSLKVGVDFRRLSPAYGNVAYGQQALFRDVPSSTSGNLFFSSISSGRSGEFFFHNLGTFAQDTWRINPALTLTYGLRWDLDFAPSSNPSLLAVTGFDLSNLSNLALAPAGTPAFQTTYGNIAPRIGIAYRLAGNQNYQTVLRGGLGVFFDLATSQVGNTIRQGFYPFGASKSLRGGTYPFSSTQAAPPPIAPANLQSPGGAWGIFDPHLELPYSLQWNVTVEQALGVQESLSASYVGSKGMRLMQSARVNSPNANFGFVGLIANAATSDYHALQLKFQRRLSKGLQALTSYTWSHSIDTASAGSLFGNQANALLPSAVNQNRGPSDFDIRHVLSTGLTYDIPAPKFNSVSKAILGGWSVENIFQAQSAAPVTVHQTSTLSFIGNARIDLRPDVVSGQPLYLYGTQCLQAPPSGFGQPCPGGKGFNANAFTAPAAGRQGNLGRNALRGFGTWQWDFAVRRDFPVRESVKLQFRAEMFNILNHPNFAPPISDRSNRSQFGQSTQTLGNFLANGNVGNGSLSPLYQIGGPRSIQFALKLIF